MNLEELVNAGVIWLSQCRYGQMFYLTTDQYIGKALNLYGEFSEGEVELFRRLIKPDWTVLDIGANMGAHTVALANLAKCVHSFEPQNILFKILESNVKVNNLPNIFTYKAGVGSKLETILIPELDYSKPGNFGATSLGTGLNVVPLLTLDMLNLDCQFIKIDVEGMELEVIKGAMNTISLCRPILYVENDRDDRSVALLQQLLDLDYRVYWHLPPYYNPDNYLKNPQNIYGNTISVNLICLPREQEQNEVFEATNTNDSWRNYV